MTLLTLADAQLAYGHRALLDGAALTLADGERVALIGRNGEGKSSLLRILAGIEPPDDGTLQLAGGLTRAYVPQEPDFAAGASVFDAVAEGLAEARALHARLAQATSAAQHDALHSRLDAIDGWHWEQRVHDALARLQLDASAEVAALSGGTRKRVALAQALASAPRLLLLDEPTNHLDIDAIEWLQALLAARRGALVFVSHDRAFIDAVATRIVELDRGRLRSYEGAPPAPGTPGAFAAYQAAKARELEAEALAQARADKLLAQEEAWIRKGVEARRTRSAGRVARLEQLRRQRAQRRETLGRVRLGVDAGIPPGRIVAELRDVSVDLGGRRLVDRFGTVVQRGDRIGLIGPNGAGKTTLLRLVLGDLAPSTGTVRHGTRLAVAYFDQMRSALDLDATLADTVSPGSEWIERGGQGGARRQHVTSYLGDFLFAPERAASPVRTLSGGERNRLLLARLFALPANVLVLDEPTNDLDIDTLELLEELLQDYAGTLFLVSHDRRFLDNVVTSTIAWEGDPAFGGRPGLWREYEGGYADWRRQRERSRAAPAAPAPASAASAARQPARPAAARTKLGYKEQRELDGLPARIDALEAEQKALDARLADPGLFVRAPHEAAAAAARHAQIEDELMACLERWEALSRPVAGTP
ncbi:MAG: ATP-binding cassette domain-containing protein [Rubrivivax sp.]|nr:ATP-binding cassette domain-containing protein [Rubrivivax sp.]